jgi:hypothetical protein
MDTGIFTAETTTTTTTINIQKNRMSEPHYAQVQFIGYVSIMYSWCYHKTPCKETRMGFLASTCRLYVARSHFGAYAYEFVYLLPFAIFVFCHRLRLEQPYILNGDISSANIKYGRLRRQWMTNRAWFWEEQADWEEKNCRKPTTPQSGQLVTRTRTKPGISQTTVKRFIDIPSLPGFPGVVT